MPSCVPVSLDPSLVDCGHSRRRDLTQLLAEAAVGDPHAWKELIDRFGGLLLHITRRYGLTPDEVADVVQDTWLQLLTNAHQIRNPDSLPGWLTTTATRKSWEATRRRWREIPLGDCGAISSEVLDLEEPAGRDHAPAAPAASRGDAAASQASADRAAAGTRQPLVPGDQQATRHAGGLHRAGAPARAAPPARPSRGAEAGGRPSGVRVTPLIALPTGVRSGTTTKDVTRKDRS
jgi:DNA-directed RNA polymerase specialized sigma24 family protein